MWSALVILAIATVTLAQNMTVAPTGGVSPGTGELCLKQSQTVYNDTFDSLPSLTVGLGSLLSPSVVQGNGSIYTNGGVFEIQSLGRQGVGLAPPSPRNVLGSYRPLAGIMVMTPSQGTLKLIDLQYACGVVSGGRINPPPPQGCTITVNCTSVASPPLVTNLTYPGGAPLGRHFSYAQFSVSFNYLTSCSFLVDVDQPAAAESVAMLLDNVGYAVYNYTLASTAKPA